MAFALEAQAQLERGPFVFLDVGNRGDGLVLRQSRAVRRGRPFGQRPHLLWFRFTPKNNLSTARSRISVGSSVGSASQSRGPRVLRGEPVGAPLASSSLLLLAEQAEVGQAGGFRVQLGVREGPEVADRAGHRSLHVVGRARAVTGHEAEHEVRGRRERRRRVVVRAQVPASFATTGSSACRESSPTPM